MVGGEGTRLRPLTLSTPKQMLPIVDVPMIERVLGHLGEHGIDEAVLSLGYLPGAFIDSYPRGVISGIRVSYAVEPEPLDTGGAIGFAAAFAEIDDTFVVVNGDVLTDMNITDLVAFHREHHAEGTIALHPVSDPSSFGVVPTDASGRVLAFVEKPPRDEAPTNEINAGTYVLEPTFLSRVPTGRRVSIERETFPAMVADGRLFARSDEAYWLDTGTAVDFLQANRDIVGGKRNAPPCPGSRRILGDTWVTGSPTLEGTVTGPTFVGDGSVVTEGAVVERSVLGPGCVVEGYARVLDSVLLAGSRVAQKSSVAGSILGAGSTVGERCDIRPVSVLGQGTVVPSGTIVDGERIPA
ncbi:MAG: sugar phosphate nucleotidyltransferase [Acidimicrobiales bacterium]